MRLLDPLAQDLRYALRVMHRSRGFTAVAVLSLALGIGANTAIFSLIDTLMLRNLPIAHPEQVVQMLTQFPQPGEPRGGFFTKRTYDLFRTGNHVFTGITMVVSPFPFGRIAVRQQESDPHPGDAALVEGSFFQLLGVKAALGRLIAPQDDQVGAPASSVAVLSWPYWKSRFSMDPAIVGKRILVEDVPVTVIGVAARDFVGLQLGEPQDAWVPLALERPVRHLPPNDDWHSGPLIARLKPGVSLEQARSEMTVLFHQAGDDEVRTSNNQLRKFSFFVEPAGAGLSQLRDEYGKPLLVVMAVVGLMLLIACTNVASMMLARGAARQREMALRVSLGAGRFRLLRQVLTESVLLSLAGTLLGVLLAFSGTRALVRVIESARQPIALDVHPDLRVLWFAAAIALATGILFGLAPALHAMSTAPASALRDGGRAAETRWRRLFGKGLVASQVAFSIVLLSAAGLFVRHLQNLRGSDLGFRPDHVLLVTIGPAGPAYDRARLSLAYQELLVRLGAIPGVRAATITGVSPIRNMGAGRAVTVEGYQAQPGERRRVSLNWIAPRFFETMGIPIVVGRDFTARDSGGPPVAIVSQTFARYYFGGASPIGRHVQFDQRPGSYEIVGVAGDARYSDAHEPMVRVIYLDVFQDWIAASNFALRTTIDPAAAAGAARRAVRDVLPTVAVNRVITLTDQIDQSIVPERLVAMLSGLFGVLGSLLAAIGLYGLLAYTVARRIAEIGIRMALGATGRDIARLVLRDALAMVCAGLAVGVPMTIWGKRFAASVVEGLKLEVGLPVAIGVLAMIAIALLASYWPARRASRVDPIVALRYE